MIGVIAKASITPGSSQAFEKVAHQLVEETRKEAGCISYNFASLVEEGSEDEYAFFERWESRQVLEEHLATAHFTAAEKEWEKYLAEELEVRIYDL